VWFHYAVEEEWERWETETYTDKDGQSRTRQVRKTGWETVAQGGAAPAFFVEDETGAVLVRPEGASVEAVAVFDETVERGAALYFAKGPVQEIAHSRHRRRFHERALPVGAALFVAGRARERADAVAPEIARDKEQELFLISCRGEEKVQRGYRLQFWLLGALALAPLPLAAWLIARQQGAAPDGRLLGGAAAGVAILWAVSWFWMSFNSLVQLRNRVAQAWSLVEVQLQRRHDLIPRLVGVVTGLRDHERNVGTEVAALRAQAEATPPGEPGVDVAGTGATLRVVAERYPELKGNDAFLRLQRELAETETRIALARDYFNAIATFAQTRREIVPDRWIAPLAGLKARPLFTAESFERAAVAVKLND
jgi:hypothetical protein